MANYSQTLQPIANPVQSGAGELTLKAAQVEGVSLAEAGRSRAMQIEVEGRTVASNIAALAQGDVISTDVKGRAAASAIETTGRAAGEGVALRGKASATEQNAQTDMLAFLGTTAVDAAKGYLSSEVSKDIKNALDNLEGVGDKALTRERNLNEFLQSDSFIGRVEEDLSNALLATDGSVAAKNAVTEEFAADLARYRSAMLQGNLTREEVLTRVAAAVKKSSALMPGWASEFRKVAADMTGVDRADVYGVHKALLTESAREKALQQRMQAQFELDKDIARTYGIPLDRIDNRVRADHAYSKSLSIAAENNANKMKLVNGGQELVDKEWVGKVVSPIVGASIAGISAQIGTLTELNGKTDKYMQSQEFGLALTGLLQTSLATVVSQIQGLTNANVHKQPLSDEAARKQIEQTTNIFKTYQESVKTIEGRNRFLQIVKNASDRKELMINTFLAAEPHVAMLQSLGVGSAVFDAALKLGTGPEFERIFGKGLAQAFDKIKNMPDVHANALRSAAEGKPVDLRQVSQVSPELATVVCADLVACAAEWAKDPQPTPQKQKAWSNTFFTLTQNLVPTVERDVDALWTIVSQPTTEEFVAGLSPDLKRNALLPLANKLDYTMKETHSSVLQSIAEFNNPSKSVLAMNGARLDLVNNPITKEFEVKVTPPKIVGEVFSSSDPSQPARYGLLGAARAVIGGSFQNMPVRSEHLDSAKAHAALLNKQVGIYTRTFRMLNPDDHIDEATVRKQIVQPVVPRNASNAPASNTAVAATGNTNQWWRAE